tara:strand:+ start:787 stop:1548 length:762 start_codon:yes stop_codon:yes gene_type:complete
MDIKYNFIGNLIRAGGDAKTVKGNDDGYLTAIMYMTPWKSFGVNLCPSAELAACIVGCLNTAGRGAMNSVQKGRARKTEWYVKDRQGFMAQLHKDLTRFQRYCAKRDLKPCVRLNGTSDIRWEIILINGQSIFDQFPEIQFYDYSKIANRKVDHIANYDLTFSYSEANPAYAKQVNIALERGLNIAVVFRDKDQIPKSFLGLPVVNGDKNDMRFQDPKQSIVALYAKGKARKDTSGFVIDGLALNASANRLAA